MNASDLSGLNSSNMNWKLNEEREIAFQFHRLINEYRAQNKLQALSWNDTLWLAARNHNLWMQKEKKLSHRESSKNEFYTGEKPSERLKYVYSHPLFFDWNGENCLYIGGYTSPIRVAPEAIALEIFNDWKNSSGHNQNMLNKTHQNHGFSIFIDQNGTLWATDLFGTSRYYSTKNNVDFGRLDNPKLKTDQGIKLLKIVKFLYAQEGIEKIPINDVWHHEAQNQLSGFIFNERDSIIQYEYHKRIERPVLPFFKKQSINVFMYVQKTKNYHEEHLSRLFLPNKFSKVGYSAMKLKRNSEDYIVIARISADD